MLQLTRKEFLLGAFGVACAFALPGCSGRSESTVVIYSCAEGVRNESLLAAMHDRFPLYDIRLRYIPTGNCAAKLKMEGAQSEADIVLGLEGGYLKQVADQFEELSASDASRYCADLVDADNCFFPFSRESACIAINEVAFAERGLDVPRSYEDLTDPAFRGLVTMPNPKSSGTGYNFVKSLVNAWGEDATFDYFDRLADNVYQFASSGSGPVNALVQGEAAVGLGMTFQAVSEINQGVPLRVLFFEEGAPWAVYGLGIVRGKGDRSVVREVFDWLAIEGVRIDNETYVPDQVLVDFKAEIPNYPTDIVYADMTGITDPDEKQRLLSKWKY
ncbi:extracellular solute-binding protein [Eggerthella lenta]|uniref:Extracellular solute-binding protein n=1 Tax=Eggerthella lenta TaxID=84112 RepID=A0A5C5BU12_EGGLN|nr:extracellular solute-binding protein [Eggerthella lenta]